MKRINWKKIHRFQETPGWCGPAIVQMILLTKGHKISQKDIARAIYKKWWGTSQTLLTAYLSKYFNDLGYKYHCNIRNIKNQILKGNIVIVNWWDDLDGSTPDGHYSLVTGFNNNKTIELCDPSKSRKGIWNMEVKEFKKRWYDTSDLVGKNKVYKWMAWINPNSYLL
jgi:ABC-type bacteriocin/lantibiotic exporter with double-glycine peptidase domain